MLKCPRINTRQIYIDKLLDLVDLDESLSNSLIWDNELKSLLIESLLIKIPIGTFWLENNNNTTVIDGSQRLLTLKSFTEDGFNLTGLTYKPECNGLNWSDLPQYYKRRIVGTSMTVFEVSSCTTEAKEDLLKRIKQI